LPDLESTRPVVECAYYFNDTTVAVRKISCSVLSVAGKFIRRDEKTKRNEKTPTHLPGLGIGATGCLVLASRRTRRPQLEKSLRQRSESLPPFVRRVEKKKTPTHWPGLGIGATGCLVLASRRTRRPQLEKSLRPRSKSLPLRSRAAEKKTPTHLSGLGIGATGCRVLASRRSRRPQLEKSLRQRSKSLPLLIPFAATIKTKKTPTHLPGLGIGATSCLVLKGEHDGRSSKNLSGAF